MAVIFVRMITDKVKITSVFDKITSVFVKIPSVFDKIPTGFSIFLYLVII